MTRLHNSLSLLALAVAALAAGCAETTAIAPHQSMTARPQSIQSQPTNGAIFHPGTRTLFEDRRGRYIGDTLIIEIAENTSASKGVSSSTSHASDTSMSVPLYTGLPGRTLMPSLSATSQSTFKGDGAAASNNVFTGTLAVTVTEVLPNGNLRVAGEKQVTINQGTEYIRFTGVVNPDFISGNNSVMSYQVADARIEYTGKGYLNDAARMGWLQRFFQTVLPF